MRMRAHRTTPMEFATWAKPIILCKHRLQWIIQSSDGYRAGQSRWAGKSYVTTRKKLIELCRELEGFYEQDYLPILLKLSDSVGVQANG